MNLARIGVTLVAVGIFAATTGSAQEGTEAPIDPEAIAVALKAANHIASARSFRVTEEASWDVLQEDGRMLEYGARREIAVQRPDKFLADVVSREEGSRGLRFDGERVVIFSPDANIYAVAEHEGDLATMLDFVIDKLQTAVPAAELFRADAPGILEGEIVEADFVDQVVIDGVPCDHISLRGKNTDAQFWVQREGDPVLHRFVLSFKREEGMPQYTARFVSWAFDAQLSEADFTFAPDIDDERVPFLVQDAGASQREVSQ